MCKRKGFPMNEKVNFNQRQMDAICRTATVEMLSELLARENIPNERIVDFGTLAVEVPYKMGDETLYRWVTLKVVIPRDQSPEWLDQQIYAYEDRVNKERDKEAKAAAREKESKEKQAKRAAKQNA